MKNWKIRTFILLTDMANEKDIDIAELFYEYNFNDKEMKDYYEWANNL